MSKDFDLLLKVPQEPLIRNNEFLARQLHTEKVLLYSLFQAINIIYYNYNIMVYCANIQALTSVIGLRLYISAIHLLTMVYILHIVNYIL